MRMPVFLVRADRCTRVINSLAEDSASIPKKSTTATAVRIVCCRVAVPGPWSCCLSVYPGVETATPSCSVSCPAN